MTAASDDDVERRQFEKIEIESIIADAINMVTNTVIDERLDVTREFLLSERYSQIRRQAIENTMRIWWR